MRIGIFGGTFNPPHIGHLILATESKYQANIDLLLWVITQSPPHKQNIIIAELQHRLKMVAATIGSDENFQLSRIEIDRPGPHFAVDTVRILQELHPSDEIIYVMGSDSLVDLPTWHKPKILVQRLAGIAVMKRPGETPNLEKLNEVIPGLSQKVISINAPTIDISSSDIRERVRSYRPYRYFVVPKVFQIIENKGLYR